MKRKVFIKLSAFSAAAVTLPFSYGCTGNDAKKILAQPEFLSKLLDKKTLSQTGQEYLKKFPMENDEKKLTDLLIEKNVVTQSSDAEAIHSFINKRIHDDFETGNTVIINGWVLSLTEARQCALSSLSQN